MENSFLLVLVALICFISIVGCTSSPTKAQEEAVNTTIIPTRVSSVQTVAPTQISTAPVTVTINESFTGVDVNRHFLDITFGRANSYLTKVTTGSAYKVAYTLNGKNMDSDADIITDFAKNYNSLTSTTTFDNPPIRTDEKGIHIEFYPQDYLQSLDEKYITYKELDPSSGNYLFILYSGSDQPRYYINSDLTGDVRKHYIMKAMLFSLGFQGTTNTYPDSFFYANTINHVNLSPIDKAAINVMYDSRIQNGMSINDAKNALLIDR